MTARDLRRFAAAQFRTEKLTLCRALRCEPIATAEPGELLEVFGYPSTIVSVERDAKGARIGAEVQSWIPDAMLAGEIAAGRFEIAKVQPEVTP